LTVLVLTFSSLEKEGILGNTAGRRAGDVSFQEWAGGAEGKVSQLMWQSYWTGVYFCGRAWARFYCNLQICVAAILTRIDGREFCDKHLFSNFLLFVDVFVATFFCSL